MKKDTPQSNGMPHPFGNPEGVYGATPQSNTDWREVSFYVKEKDIKTLINSIPIEITIDELSISQLLEAEKKRWREEVDKLADKYEDYTDCEWHHFYGELLQKLS